MKLHFESDLPYQLEAVEAVCDLFRGQEICRSEFTVTLPAPSGPQTTLDGLQETAQGGVGNRMTLLDDQLETNLRAVQLRNDIKPAELSNDFTVEMETGTGKTYVYLRTVLELHRRYGFTKFVVVVPSVAIKEGVTATLKSTREHFETLYPGAKGYEYFQYDSDKLGQVRNFATSPNIQIMVLTVGAINKFGDETTAAEEANQSAKLAKSKNKMYLPSEKTGGERPIDLVMATRPILIVDEPQSVDGGMDGKGRQALERMRPLCTLRYSATHVDKHNMVYSLNAVDAYEQRLVKQIEVAGAVVEGGHNKPYVKLVSVSNKKGLVTAKVELDIESAGRVQRREVIVQDLDDLQFTTGRDVYANMRVGEINATKGASFLELKVPGGEEFLKVGETYGDVDESAVHRQMIRRTILEHLEKELRLRPQGIKVLSLFFIDQVSKYRQYDEQGNAIKGEYAMVFEEEYKRLAKQPKYNGLFQEIDLAHAAEDVHNGYFSVDKTVHTPFEDIELAKGASKEALETSTYNLIMKEKEKLLRLDTPLKFIFSHSALKEGWDNPNVFQICNFSKSETERWRRQTIGRGLRLCVNQNGDRVRGFEVNTLTVIATERYEDFAASLQREMEDPKDGIGIKFGVVESHVFAGLLMPQASGDQAPLGYEASSALWTHLKASGYINEKGLVQDSLRTAIKLGTLVLPAELHPIQSEIIAKLLKCCGKLEVKNADDRRTIAVRKSVLLSPEFKALWDRIKHKTTYRVHFDNDKLIERCIDAVREMQVVPRTRMQWRKAELAIGQSGVEAHESGTSDTFNLEDRDIVLPDLLTEMQDRTQLTRKTIATVLTGSRRLNDFKNNPQKFIELASEAIGRCKRLALVDGIRYQQLGPDQYYAQELFETTELSGYLKNLVENTTKSVYEHVVCDSDTERDFALALERNEAVKVFAKLPGWFKVPTPLGSYNPDWAVVIEQDGKERVYFVIETKSSLFIDDLRSGESAKIDCGKAHFRAIEVAENPARYTKARVLEDVLG
jgi:type III restriction enzyme